MQEQLNNMNELIEKVEQWAKDRNIVDGCPAIKQAYKTLEECGELIEAVSALSVVEDLKFNYDMKSPIEVEQAHYNGKIQDAIGDIIVTLIIQCAMQGVSLEECLRGAYNEIKDRKGKLINGQFVKEA